MGALIVIAFLLTILGLYLYFRQKAYDKSENRAKLLDAAEERIEHFISDYSVTTMGNHARFCVDSKSRYVAVIEIVDEDDYIDILPYEDIMSVAVVKDGKTTIEKSTTRAIGGAVIGGLVGGIGGMVVGGLSGDQQVSTSVEKVAVVIKTRDMGKPSIEIDCMNGSLDSVTALTDAQSIADMVSIIIDQVDKEQKA